MKTRSIIYAARARLVWGPALAGLTLLAGLAGGCAPIASWDYLSMGVFAREAEGISSIPSQYAEMIEKDQRVRVAIHNQTRMEPHEIAESLRSDEQLRQLVRDAEVITFDFSLEWINVPEGLFRAGMCGGTDNQDCMRRGVEQAKDTWTSIADELMALRAGQPVLIRVVVMGDYWLEWSVGPPSAGGPAADADKKIQVIGGYYRQLTDFLEEDAQRRGIPVVRAFPEPYFFQGAPPEEYFGGVGGIHFSDEGSAVLAQLLRAIGYEPVILE